MGNVEVGGTGKTPHVMDAARRLQQLLGEHAVGVLSRGYGRTTTGFVWVSDALDWNEVGDEPWMIQSHLPGLAVAVCENRPRGLARMARDCPNLRAVVLDDGMQHRALRPDILIGLMGRPRPKGMSWFALMPAGPFRDLPSSLHRCDHLVDTSGHHPECQWSSRTESGAPQRWPNSRSGKEDVLENPVLMVTGIARPHRVLTSAQQHSEVLGHAFYPDHHAFTRQDVANWLDWMNETGIASLLTTEKDAVRLSTHQDALAGIDVWVLPLHLVWHTEAPYQAFLETWAQTLPSQSKPTSVNET